MKKDLEMRVTTNETLKEKNKELVEQIAQLNKEKAELE